jgi:hypothetical protein
MTPAQQVLAALEQHLQLAGLRLHTLAEAEAGALASILLEAAEVAAAARAPQLETPQQAPQIQAEAAAAHLTVLTAAALAGLVLSSFVILTLMPLRRLQQDHQQ